MTSDKIVVFGPEGMLGRYVVKYLQKQGYDVFPVNRAEHDIMADGLGRLYNLLEDRIGITNESVIVNCAGIIKQRDFKLNELIEVNSLFPHNLAEVANPIGTKVIHITTDCVYSGKDGWYNEYARHDCLDEYGKSKSLGESPSNCNIRTSIIGEELKNKLSLIEWAKANAGKEVDGYTNHLWNGLTCLQLSKEIELIIRDSLYWEGVRHFYSAYDELEEILDENRDSQRKYELLKQISYIYGLNLMITPKKHVQYIDRRLYSAHAIGQVRVPILEQLKEQKEFQL
jgi:dTDP-4-dehydrorhamnose reductase